MLSNKLTPKNLFIVKLPHASLWFSPTLSLKTKLCDAQFYYSRAENKFDKHFAHIQHQTPVSHDERLIDYILNDTDHVDHYEDDHKHMLNCTLLNECIADYLKAIAIYEQLPKEVRDNHNELIHSNDSIKDQWFFSYTHLAYCYTLKYDLTNFQDYIKKSILIYDWAISKKPHLETRLLEPSQEANIFTIKGIRQYLNAFEAGRDMPPAYLKLYEVLSPRSRLQNKK